MASAEQAVSLAFSCACGEMTGELTPQALRAGTHVECFCADCRAAHLYLGQSDPRPGGIRLFQTTPNQIGFRSGASSLRLFRLGPNGLFRWYAGCCNVPFGNTLTRPGLPFLALMVDRLQDDEALGPVRVRSFVPVAPGKPARHDGAFLMVSRLAVQMARARLSGHWRKTPFFDVETGRPIADPVVLDPAARAALKAR